METVWKLNKYARWHEKDKRWDVQISDCKEDLWISLTKTRHLVICKGTHNIQENLRLWGDASHLKAIVKEDSILFISHLQNESRRFRMQFAECKGQSSVANCRQFTQLLSKLIPFKILSEGDAEETPKTPVALETLTTLLMSKQQSLPKAYRQATSEPPVAMETMLRLCLTDSNFPSFVGQIEEELKKITEA